MTLAIHALHELEDPDVLRALLQAGEGQTLEYKTRLPPIPLLARIIAGFANADGGLLLVGYDEGTRSVLGIDSAQAFIRAVERALKRVAPYPEAISFGAVNYTHAGEKTLGAVLIWPAGARPLVVNNGDYVARRGDRTVAYESAPAMRTASALADTSVAPVALRISTQEIDDFLASASEDIFTDLLVAPLMRARGFSLARKGHRDKTLEFGQDFRAMKYQLPTGHWLYFAAQIKAGAIGYSPQKTDSIDKILEQIRMAFNARMTFWDTRAEHRPDHVFLVASGHIVEGARVYLRDAVADGREKVLLWDKEQIVEACTGSGLPEPIQTDIRRYLASNSDSDGSGDAA